ncbi:MAG: hypothetical protein IJ538_02250 [Clostridia bacterium]|nr:hypothetical protein [Clostridia bacterium]
MEFYDTFDQNGVFQSAEDEHDVHYKGLWHKIIRSWLYDNNGNIYLRVRAEGNKADCLNEVHLLSQESVINCFDRGMYEKLGIHFPATSNVEQVSLKKVKIHKVYTDDSELRENYFLCDYIGEFENDATFFIFNPDTTGLIKANAKGILNLLNTRTGEIIAYKVSPNEEGEKIFLTIDDIYENSDEDTYEKYNPILNAIIKYADIRKKELIEEEKMQRIVKKHQESEEEFVSHADDNDGSILY